MTNTAEGPALLRCGTSLRAKMAVGPTYGLFLVSGNATIAEAAAYTGIDWAIVDREAAAMTRVDALHQARAMTGTDVTTIVRVSNLDRHHIGSALDLGVAGIMVPKVDGADDAGLAARFSRYPPDGHRGVNPIRAGAYHSGSKQYLDSANRDVLCIVQIETREALRNVDKIAQTVGVDVLFIGANDLAMDLGQPGNPTGPALDAARQAVLAACEAAGKPAGIVARDTKSARTCASEGFRFICIGNDVGFFVQSAASTLGMLRR